MRVSLWISALVSCGLAGCCSAAASGAVSTGAVVAPAVSVTNAPTSGGTLGVPGPTTSPPPPPVQSTYLWCANRTGPACRNVATGLGLEPVGPEGMPELVFGTMEDLANDCDAAGMRELSGRLGSLLGLPAERWHDHGGTVLPREHVGDIFYAAGCLNCCNPTLPAVKMSVALGPPRTVLVRVWEIGMMR